MMSHGIDCEGLLDPGFGYEADAALDAGGQRNRDLVDVDYKLTVVPRHRTGSNLQIRGIALERHAASFGHGPTPGSPVQRDIDGDVVFGISRSASPRKPVIGRKHAAHEPDDC
jgi:hypothetical protein